MKRKKLAVFIIAVTALLTIVSVFQNSSISIADAEELGKSLGFLTLIPTVESVILAFVTQNVLFSLLIGFLSGVLLLGVVYSYNILDMFLKIGKYLINIISSVVFDLDNIEILVLCFIIGAMIEVIKTSGGFEALAKKLYKKLNTSSKATFVASLIGCLIFFDDYANALIVGPIMKPITDRVKVSREKLSFIVDSTAAPVSGIALVSSWIAVEISSINMGLELIGRDSNGFSLYLNCIPFCFYCLFAISFIFVNSIIGKDFGPMLKAENMKLNLDTHEDEIVDVEYVSDSQIDTNINTRIFIAIGSIVLLVVLTISLFYIQGRSAAISSGALIDAAKFNLTNLMLAMSCADTVNLITLSSIIVIIITVIIGCNKKLFKINDCVKAFSIGIKNMSSTILMLILAWCLAETSKLLGTIYFAVEIISMNVNPLLVPVLIFVCCCLISCASGSFGCMFVVMPLSIALAFNVNNSETYLLLCIGSVIAGSIFGDHCSPVTDCTILSALGCGLTTMDHCYSQLPYTLLNALISIMCGILLTSYGVNVFVSIIIGILMQILVLLLIGKKPTKERKNYV